MTTRPLGLPPQPHPATSSSDSFADAAHAFRRFFAELQDAFFERETLLTQIQLALLCREHVLVTGPPGTAKSAVANSVLGRIVDATSGQPSLFSKQLCETTVQADLIGPVNFKVLTETGRTEYLTDEGMLGAIHAFLDEVFDGRDMLLRSILNVLHERELKHGRKVTAGRLECAIMTSNRYLSEAVARSPELLLAFADRLSFICFVPKAFARPQSRAGMLQRATTGQRPELTSHLTIQHLDALQAAVERVEVGAAVREGIELLAQRLERALGQQLAKLPDYVPTKTFSQRSVVKALWALKAWVVQDAVFRRPGRPLEANLQDLAGLRWFFLLGGPPPEETEALLKEAVDPRERAQLEIIRLEHRAFDEAIQQALQDLPGSEEREAAELKVSTDREAAREQLRSYQGEGALGAANTLLRKLVPGPRHPSNRAALLDAAEWLVEATAQHARRGIAGQGEGRGGKAVLDAFHQVLELCRRVPELSDALSGLVESTAGFCGQALEMTALSAESTEFDDALRIDGLLKLLTRIQEELDGARSFLASLAMTAPGQAEALFEQERRARHRAAEAIRRRSPPLFRASAEQEAISIDLLQASARRVATLEDQLTALSGSPPGLRAQLLGPVAVSYVRTLIAQTPFARLEELAGVLHQTAQQLKREAIPAEPVFAQCLEALEARLTGWTEKQAQQPAAPALAATRALSGEAYLDYRGAFTSDSADGELNAVRVIEALAGDEPRAKSLAEHLRAGLASFELRQAKARVQFLGSWLGQLMQQLPDPAAITQRNEADRAFAALVKSRLPQLAVKEGELLRIGSSLKALAQLPGEPGERAQHLDRELQRVSETFGQFSKTLLHVRARR